MEEIRKAAQAQRQQQENPEAQEPTSGENAEMSSVAISTEKTPETASQRAQGTAQ